MRGYETPAERYRHHAEECLTVANMLSPGDQRDVILQMAEEWLRLAHEYSAGTWPFSRKWKPRIGRGFPSSPWNL